MSIISALLPIVGDVVKSVFPDKESQQKMQAELTNKLIERQSEIESKASEIVKTEAASQHWLAANWRPLLMLTFGFLIVARWFGWSAPNLSEEEYLALWGIVEIGIGGYVVGRSAEKVLPEVVRAIKNK